MFWLEVALNYGLFTFVFLCQSMVNIFPPVHVPLFLGQLSSSVVAQNKFCPLVSKAGLISVRNKGCVHPRPAFYSEATTLSDLWTILKKNAIRALHRLNQECVNYPKSWDSGEQKNTSFRSRNVITSMAPAALNCHNRLLFREK